MKHHNEKKKKKKKKHKQFEKTAQIFQRAQDVGTTLIKRRFNVLMLNKR